MGSLEVVSHLVGIIHAKGQTVFLAERGFNTSTEAKAFVCIGPVYAVHIIRNPIFIGIGTAQHQIILQAPFKSEAELVLVNELEVKLPATVNLFQSPIRKS